MLGSLASRQVAVRFRRRRLVRERRVHGFSPLWRLDQLLDKQVQDTAECLYSCLVVLERHLAGRDGAVADSAEGLERLLDARIDASSLDEGPHVVGQESRPLSDVWHELRKRRGVDPRVEQALETF